MRQCRAVVIDPKSGEARRCERRATRKRSMLCEEHDPKVALERQVGYQLEHLEQIRQRLSVSLRTPDELLSLLELTAGGALADKIKPSQGKVLIGAVGMALRVLETQRALETTEPVEVTVSEDEVLERIRAIYGLPPVKTIEEK